MTSAELRATCLALDGTTETFPFSAGTSVFKAPNGKIFAIAPLEAEPLEISVKCVPDRAAELRRVHEAIRPGYHLNKRHWITLTLGGDANDLVAGLVEDSYELVA